MCNHFVIACSRSEGMSSVRGCLTEGFPVGGTGGIYGSTGREATYNTRGCVLSLAFKLCYHLLLLLASEFELFD